MPKPQKIVILMSDTGGGHRSAANAIRETCQYLYPNQYEFAIVDILSDYAPWPINQSPRTYLPMVNYAPWMWRSLWWLGNRQFAYEAVKSQLGLVVGYRLRRLWQIEQPDLVVSVHPLLNTIPLRSLRAARLRAPFATVVTDLATIVPLWVEPHVNRLIVPTREAYELVRSYGFPKSKLRQVGQPVSLKFQQPPRDPRSLRQQLGLELDRDIVLMTAGGEGMGPVAVFAQAIAHRLAEEDRYPRLVIIAGRNEALRRKLAGLVWPIPVTITGFVNNMPDWMQAATVMVAKAGPGTIIEGLLSGLPILLDGYVPGQEEGNVPFVVNNGVGAFSQNPQEVAEILADWLRPANPIIAQMKERARKLVRPTATQDLVRELVGMIHS